MNEELNLRDLFALAVAAGIASTDLNLNSSTCRRVLALAAYATADELLRARSVEDDAGQVK